MKLAAVAYCGHGWYGTGAPCPFCSRGDIPPGGKVDPRCS